MHTMDELEGRGVVDRNSLESDSESGKWGLVSPFPTSSILFVERESVCERECLLLSKRATGIVLHA